MTFEEKIHLLALNSLRDVGVGYKRTKSLREYFGSFKAVWEASTDELKESGVLSESTLEGFVFARENFDLEQPYKKLIKYGINCLTYLDNDYPHQLSLLKDSPLIIYFKGNLSNPKKSISIVGSRHPSENAKSQVIDIAERLTNDGYSIISGLALGIDAVAHKGCLKGQGYTVAVLANGPERPIPHSNLEIYKEILDSGGCIMSEYPPETETQKGFFPARNRIIAALGQATLVGEAAAGSGALITAEKAIEMNKIVFGLAGHPSPMNEGIFKWIRKGMAKLVTGYDDLKEELDNLSHEGVSMTLDLGVLNSLSVQRKNATLKNITKDKLQQIPEEKVVVNLNDEEKKLVSILKKDKFQSFDLLIQSSGFSISKVNVLLVSLQMKKLIERDLSGSVKLK
jgi:DNA processing protein